MGIADGLGLFVLASAAAGFLSSYVWGRLADLSSRQVLRASGWIAAIPLACAASLGLLAPTPLQTPGLLPGLLFVLLIAYQGVRLGRTTHLVDMAGADLRAAYTALSNTIVGVVLIGASVFGLLASMVGEGAVLAAFALMCVLGGWVAAGLEEVQPD